MKITTTHKGDGFYEIVKDSTPVGVCQKGTDGVFRLTMAEVGTRAYLTMQAVKQFVRFYFTVQKREVA